MPPPSHYPLVNSTLALSPSISSFSLSSSFSMGWTLRRSLASSIALLQPLYISPTPSVTKASNSMTIPKTATTVASSSVTAARIPNGNIIIAGAGGGGRSDTCRRKSWRATRLLGSFCHLKQSRSSILPTTLVNSPRLTESSISSAVSFSLSTSLASSNSSSDLTQPLNDSGIILSQSRHFSSSSKSTNDESEGRRMIIGSKLSSARAQAAIKLLPSYIADARAVKKYSPISSPEGALQLSVAENQLCELPITGMIGIVESGQSEGVMQGGEGLGVPFACNREEMTLTEVLSKLASSNLPRPSDIDGGDAITTGNVFQREMIYYQPTQGIPSLRRVMANYLQRLLLSPSNMQSLSSSRQFNPDNLILGAGCNAVLENLCMCLANPGDAVLIPTPYYASFEFDLSARAGCHIIPVNTFSHHPDGQTAPLSCNEPIAQEFYYPNRSSLDAAYHRAQLETGRPPRILLLSHPNNPLGICYPPHVVQECIDWCREKEVHLISDEIYAGSVYRKERTGKEKGQPTFVSAMALGSSTSDKSSHSGLGLGSYIHLVYALSKDFALSGLRVGVTYTENKEILLPLQKLNDMCQMSSQTQLLVERMMCANAIMDEDNTRGNNKGGLSQKFSDVYMRVNNDHIRARCDKLHTFLSNIGIPFLPADSGLFVWMDLRQFLPPYAAGVSEATESIESKEFRERQLYLLLMNKYGLLFTPGMSMRSERAGFFRFVFTAATGDEFDLGLKRLKKMVEEMRMVTVK